MVSSGEQQQTSENTLRLTQARPHYERDNCYILEATGVTMCVSKTSVDSWELTAPNSSQFGCKNGSYLYFEASSFQRT